MVATTELLNGASPSVDFALLLLERELSLPHKSGVLQETAQAEGMSSLRMDGIQKIFKGLTDLAQVNRVVL